MRVLAGHGWRLRLGMTTLVLLGLLGSTGAAAQGSEISRVEAEIARADALFSEWRYDEAFVIAERLYAEHPGLPPVQYLAGKAKFYQQDYPGAVALLGRATAGRPEGGDEDRMLRYALATQEITEGFVSRRSKHFELRVPPGVDEVLPPYALEALEQAHARLGEDFGYAPTRPVVVEAYASAAELSAASGLPVEAIKTSGTIAVCKHNKLMFTSPKALLRGYEWLDTLAHEYVHYVVGRASHNTVPIWLHEGLAKYSETSWNGEPGRALSPWSERLLARAVQGKTPFITFEEMHPSMALLPSQEATALAFAEVFSAIEYLVTERGGYAAVRQMIAALRSGKSDKEAVAEAVGVPFATFEKDWKAWLKRRPLRTDTGAREKTLTFKEDVKGKVVESAEDEADAGEDVEHPTAKRHAHLGELLRMRGREQAAAVEYEKAYAAVGPKAPLLSSKLAVTYMGLQRWDRAEEVLKASLGPNPDFVTTHVHLGRLYLATERPELAEASFLRANEINPFDPEIHGSLWSVYKKRGDTARADREARAFALLDAGRRHGRAAPEATPATEGEVGWLSIHSTPWAQVKIDGQSTGMTTPLFRHPLPPGRHEIHLQSESALVQKELVVEIREGAEEKLVVKLD